MPSGYPSRADRNGSGAEGLVQRLVDQLVGALVVLAPDGAHGPGVEPAQLAHGLQEERLQAGVLDLVLAADLAGHELRVVDDLDLVGAQLAGQLEPEQQRPVLRDVVGGLADVGAALAEDVALGRGRDRGGSCGAGVAAGPAVHVDDQLHASSGASIVGKLPFARWRRFSLKGGWSPGRPPWPRRSTITSTFGSSL